MVTPVENCLWKPVCVVILLVWQSCICVVVGSFYILAWYRTRAKRRHQKLFRLALRLLMLSALRIKPTIFQSQVDALWSSCRI